MQNEDITIVGQPSTYIDSTTEYISFNADSILNYIPTELFKYFSNFRGYLSYFSQTTTIVTDAFYYCPKLEVIYIYYSSFSNLPAGFAQSCSKVFYIEIQYNNIETISPDAFMGLTNLQYVLLGYNKITCIPAGLFDLPFVNLQKIDFSYNPIELIDSRVFRNIPTLQTLNLNGCSIAVIQNFYFYCTGVINGLQVSFDDNPIIAVDPNFLYSAFIDRHADNNFLEFTFLNTSGEFQACMPDILNTGSVIYQGNYETAKNYFLNCYDSWTLIDGGNLQSPCAPPPGPSILHTYCAATSTTDLTTPTTTDNIITDTTTTIEGTTSLTDTTTESTTIVEGTTSSTSEATTTSSG